MGNREGAYMHQATSDQAPGDPARGGATPDEGTSPAASGDPAVTPWIGINHLALITDDMDATVRFWHGVLGAELVATVAQPNFRHYFFRFGERTTVAFFEYLDGNSPLPTDRVIKPAGVFDRRAGQFDHLSLDVPDEAALVGLQQRLRAAGCEASEIVDHGIIRSVYFTDPSGIALEASYWVRLPTTATGRLDDPAWFADDDPVPAVRELQAGGLTHTPVTRLVDTITAS